MMRAMLLTSSIVVAFGLGVATGDAQGQPNPGRAPNAMGANRSPGMPGFIGPTLWPGPMAMPGLMTAPGPMATPGPRRTQQGKRAARGPRFNPPCVGLHCPFEMHGPVHDGGATHGGAGLYRGKPLE